ncbi:MAG: efflux RND transporter periplasmic adaptor subunit [Acetobacteraceae bacterium]
MPGLPRTIPATAIAVMLLLSACKPQNHYVAPPPPKVAVATPVRRDVTRHLEVNGSVEAVSTVDLVARITGFLQQIGYQDGATVQAGTTLFTIEPEPYYAKLQQAQADEASAQAALANAKVTYSRQATLGKTNAASQAAVDSAQMTLNQSSADSEKMHASTELAAINYTYTRVTAPFDGIVTRHLVSVGDLVGSSSPTKLATIIQLDPIYVTFNVPEDDVLRIRADLARRGVKITELDKVPVEVGLANETGYPHQGALNYVAPQVDAGTGTLLARAIFKNQDHVLLPGYFVRVRMPTQRAAEALLVPDTAIGSDQGGRYVLVVNDAGVVEQRHVETGPLDGAMRVIEKGLTPTDKVVVAGLQRAIPGGKVDAELQGGGKPP